MAVFLTLAGTALFLWRHSGGEAQTSPPADARAVASLAQPGPGTEGIASSAGAKPEAGASDGLDLSAARTMSTADLALRVAGLPQGFRADELPEVARLLASRGPESVIPIAAALATAGSDTARGVLADALALIGTADAVQALCSAAVQAPDAPAGSAIAAAFRGLGNPDVVPMLATVFSQTGDPGLLAEAGDAIRRLADAHGVLALAELMNEDGQFHSQRAALLEVLAGVRSPAARPALEALAAEESDPECAAAARKALADGGF